MTTKTWQPCEPSEAEAYAIRRGTDYLCKQGEESWQQSECKGWAICSADRGWVVSQMDDCADTIVPMRLTGNPQNSI